jgi:DNA-binding LytR/AlgR family response regulator
MLNKLIENGNEVNTGMNNLFVTNPISGAVKRRKTRLLVQKGIENILLKIGDIVLFYTENKVIYVIDRFEKKYFVYSTLSELENELDPSLFFRANRQYIINIDFIKSFRSYEKVKIKVDMYPESKHLIIVSQETAPFFRKWMHDA